MQDTLKTKNTFKLLVTMFACSFCFVTANGQQNDSTDIQSTVSADSADEKKMTLTLGAVYSNNANYYGQVADEKMPYIALNATLQFPFGLYISGLAYKLFTDSSWLSATALGIGYDFKIAPNFTGTLGFSHSFYPANSPFLQVSNPNMASAGISYKHFFTTGITFDYAFGTETSDYFITLSNSRAFDFYTKNNLGIFSITPQVDISAGSQQFYRTYRMKKNKKEGGKPTTPVGPPTVITEEYNQFDLLSYNFILPISYSRSSYLIEAAYQLSVLGKNVDSKAGRTNSFVTLSAYYQF